MRGRPAVALTLTMLLIAAPAAADTTRHRDRNDTDGKLDVRLVVQGHRRGSSGTPMLRHRLTMFERWGKRALSQQNNFINLFFNTDDDRGFERRLNIDVRNGRLRAKMQTWRGLDRVGFARIWRPNRRSVTVAFPKRWLGSGVRSYEWIGVALYSIKGEGPCGLQGDVHAGCSDRLPNRSRFTHNL